MQPRRRAEGFRNHHPYSAAALGQDVPKRRPSLASPLPPTPIVPSTPLPRVNPSSANHHYYQPAHQQPPSTVTSTSSSNLPDPPTARGMMKRLLAKPAPPSSPSAPFSSPSMRPGLYHANSNEDDHEKQITCPHDHQEITLSSSPSTDDLLTPRLTNEFDKSIRALDLVGQIDISMSPCTSTYLDCVIEPPESAKKQRNVFYRSPSGTAVTIPSVPTTSSSEYAIGFRSVDCSTPTSTPYTTTSIPPLHPPPLRFPCRSSSHPIPDNSSASNSSSPDELKTTHSHPTKPNEVEQSPVTPYYTVLGDHSGTNIAAGHPRGLSWDTCGEYWDKRREQRSEDDGAESTPTPSRKCGKKDSDHQSPSTSSFQEFKRSPFVEKDQAMVKQLPNTPAGDSPSRRFWKLVKKISVNGLREKNQSNSDHLPPVPPLPSDIMKNNFPLSRAISTSMLSSSPTTSLDKVYKTTIVPSTPPSTSAQRHTKLPHSAPHSPPSSVPRPSTTTRSSSPSSDVASSRFFNRQSARSSTSSLGEEAIPLPPLPKNSNPIITSKRTNADDANASCEFQQYIIPPSELSPRHSTSNLLSINTTTIAIPSNQTPPSMEDDWTIVQSPSNELEALSLPPPPRQLFKGIDIGVGLDRRKTPSDQESKAKARMRASDVIQNMPAVDIPSEQVDHKSRDVSNNARSQEDEKSVIEETTKLEQGKDMLEPNTDRDLKLSQSPTIPSFSTSSAINSFPVRRASSSLSASSATTLSPDRSNRSCENGFSTTKVLRSPSRSPCGSRTPFERVRQHLFGTSDVHVKTEESKESEEVLGSLPSGLKSDVQIAHLPQLHSLPHPPQQQEYLTKSRKHHRYSSGTTKPRSTHTVSASMPASPKIISLGRLMPFNTSSPTLPTDGLFTSASSSSNPFSDAPRASSVSTLHMPPLPPFPVAPSPTSNISHHTHTRTRSGFSSRKLSEVLFSSSSSISLSASPRSGSATSQARPSSRSSRRTFMSRSISVGARDRSKYNISNSVKPPQPRTQLTDQEKVDKWNDLLARSARAGGTLHLAADSGLLGSDDIQVEPENRG